MNRVLSLALDRYNLSPSQLLLLNVTALKQSVNAKEIGENMDLDSASVAGLTARLEKKGFLRKNKGLDRRFSEFSLTPRGKELQSLGASMLLEFELKTRSALTTEEGAQFQLMLEKMEQEWIR